VGDACLLKICGLTNAEDLRLARDSGADFFGLVIEAPASPRSLRVDEACCLAELAATQAVAVCVSDDIDFLLRLVNTMRPRALQLHTVLNADDRRRLREVAPIWQVVSLPPAGGDDPHLITAVSQTIGDAVNEGVEMIVLDTARNGRSGGTGLVSDWTLAARIVAKTPVPVLLAGGIGPENACQALAEVKPAGLDSSSRLERSPGRKDPHRVRQLIAALQAAGYR
jgi:phosphoribosylanthranilate isomerase